MNPNQQYNGSFPPGSFPSFPFLVPNQSSLSLLQSLSNPLQQTMSTIPLPYLQALNQSRADITKNPPAFDLISDPTKKIKHSQQNYTETGFKIEEVPRQTMTKREEDLGAQSALLSGLNLGMQRLPQDLLGYFENLQSLPYQNMVDKKKNIDSQNQSSLTMKEDMSSLGLNNPSLLQGLLPIGLGGNENLVTPELLELVKAQQMEQLMKQQLAQHYLGQQKAEQRAQQEFAQRIYQQQLDFLTQQQQLVQQLSQRKTNDILLDPRMDPQMRLLTGQNAFSMLNPSSNLLHGINNDNKFNIKSNTNLLIQNPTNLKPNSTKVPNFFSNATQREAEVIQGNPNLRKNLESFADLKQGKEFIAIEGNTTGSNMEILEEIKEKPEVPVQGKKGIQSVENSAKKVKDDSLHKSKQKETKKRRTYNYSYNYLNSISGKSIDQAEKVESRRENKWQMMKNQETAATASRSTRANSSRKNTMNDENGIPLEADGMTGEGENKEINPNENQEGEIKNKKEMEEEDESSKDYHYLISVTITRDPDNVGLKNAGPDFVVISHYDRMNKHYKQHGDEAPMNTNVGEEYQAKIPELELSSTRIEPKKRRGELIWNPKAIDETDIERYLKDLAKLLNCEHINQEKALKLLKRKNYKKDKVKVNISKNEKFYSSFLVVSESVKSVPNEHLTEYTNL